MEQSPPGEPMAGRLSALAPSATEERMVVVFMSVIPFSGEHAPSNEILKKWVKKTQNERDSMRNES